MLELSLAQRIAVFALPVLLAITVHEVAHGWVAKQLGDPTADRLGRLTLNPLKHIDPIGTVLVPLALLWIGGFLFGWARPVPVNFDNLRNPKRDMAIVAAAGPLSNLAMAIGWGLIARIAGWLPPEADWAAVPLVYMGLAGIAINVALMVLNLLPLPPLDGGRVAVGLLPGRLSWQLSRVEPFGFFILLGLLATGLLTKILMPFYVVIEGLVVMLTGLH
jgi:Zn-dependent protease